VTRIWLDNQGTGLRFLVGTSRGLLTRFVAFISESRIVPQQQEVLGGGRGALHGGERSASRSGRFTARVSTSTLSSRVSCSSFIATAGLEGRGSKFESSQCSRHSAPYPVCPEALPQLSCMGFPVLPLHCCERILDRRLSPPSKSFTIHHHPATRHETGST
jgi:hypothetical protein